MRKRFEGQTAWITGGGTGIGRALAVRLAAEGAKIAVSGRREERLQEVVETIRASGGTAIAVPMDVTDEQAVKAAAEAVHNHWQRIDLVIANAGFAVTGKVERLRADDWRRQFDTNVVGLAITARYALPYLRKTKGRLGLVGSVAGLIVAPGISAYTASKHAVRAIGQTLSIELIGSGVSCTLLEPGFVESEIGQVNNQGEYESEREDVRPQHLMWTAERAAASMVRALYVRKREHVFTVHGRVLAFLGQHFPGLVYRFNTFRRR